MGIRKSNAKRGKKRITTTYKRASLENRRASLENSKSPDGIIKFGEIHLSLPSTHHGKDHRVDFTGRWSPEFLRETYTLNGKTIKIPQNHYEVMYDPAMKKWKFRISHDFYDGSQYEDGGYDYEVFSDIHNGKPWDVSGDFDLLERYKYKLYDGDYKRIKYMQKIVETDYMANSHLVQNIITNADTKHARDNYKSINHHIMFG